MKYSFQKRKKGSILKRVAKAIVRTLVWQFENTPFKFIEIAYFILAVMLVTTVVVTALSLESILNESIGIGLTVTFLFLFALFKLTNMARYAEGYMGVAYVFLLIGLFVVDMIGVSLIYLAVMVIAQAIYKAIKEDSK